VGGRIDEKGHERGHAPREGHIDVKRYCRRPYRDTLLIRNFAPLGPHSRTVPRALCGGAVAFERGTPEGRCRAQSTVNLWCARAQQRRVRTAAPKEQPGKRPMASGQGTIQMAFQDFCAENGSRQGQNVALTGLFGPSSLDNRENSGFGGRGGKRFHVE